jgi:SAM-dependent methyltransferase
LLTVHYAKPKRRMHDALLVRCADCTCAFYEDQTPLEYGGKTLRQRGIVPFYLQQAAGLASLSAPLVRSGKGTGTRYLDVGCGFGFALDFAQRQLQWSARGIDPSMMAAFGREMLGVDIERRYLRDREPAYEAAFDVVMASEVIEHVPSPIAFLRTLRRVLPPGGMLILTTPDAADIVPATASGALVALLSPGFHLVLQSRESLRRLLLQAGFPEVLFEKDGHSMVVYASDRPFDLLNDRPRFRAGYIDYLVRRARDFPPTHDLYLGFAGRAFQEAVNAEAMDIAAPCYEGLREACRLRFGIDLDAIEELPPEASHCSLERLAQIIPLSLGGLLYADTMRRIGGGEPRGGFERRLLCAADAADALRRAAAEWTMDDALSEEIAWMTRAEAVLCAAAAGKPDLIERFRTIPPFPGNDDNQRKQLCERTLVTLVNAGHHDLGAAFAEASGLQQAWPADPPPEADTRSLTEIERDVLFCLAILDMRAQDLDVCARALRRFEQVRRQITACFKPGTAGELYWSAVRGEVQALTRLGLADRIRPLLLEAEAEAGQPPDDIADAATAAITGPPVQDHLVAQVNAGQYEAARGLVRFLGDSEPTGRMTARERDRLFSLAVLDAQPAGDPTRAAVRFAAVRGSLLNSHPQTDGIPELYWAALRGEIEARAASEGDAAAEHVRRKGLQAAGLPVQTIPEDLREPRQPEDETAA